MTTDIDKLDKLQTLLLQEAANGNVWAAHYGMLMLAAPDDDRRAEVADELHEKVAAVLEAVGRLCETMREIGENLTVDVAEGMEGKDCMGGTA